ncbi:MAG: amidohydrolase family protein [Ignavibacteria bacterium]|nr:amidohydrolase family protein [Ignavibacteria bacterium]
MTQWPVFPLFLLAFSLSVSGQTNPGGDRTALVLVHVHVIDATGAPAKADMTVVIEGDRITAIGASERTRIPADARLVDGRGKFLIPGLWDMHVHWYNEKYLPLFIANGVTGIRQMFGTRNLLALRQRSEDGDVLAPRQYIASPIVDGVHAVWPGSIKVGTADEARREVRNAKDAGYDFVKVYSFLSREAYFAIADEATKLGIRFGGHVPYSITPQEASEAGQHHIEHLDNLTLSCSSVEADLRQEAARINGAAEASAHPDSIAAAWRQFDQQVLDTYDQEKASLLFSRFAENHTWHCPTLTVNRAIAHLADADFRNDPRVKFMPKSITAAWLPESDFRFKTYTSHDWAIAKRQYLRGLDIVRAMCSSGVQMLASTDTHNPFCFPGFSLHDELSLLVEAGMTPMGALQAATRNPAIFMGKDGSLGTIEAGKLADLVLLDENPLIDIGNTRRIAAVVIGGTLFDRAQLNAMLANGERMAGIPSIAEVLSRTLDTQSVEVALLQYRSLKATSPDAYNFDAEEINGLGYRLLEAKRVKDAIGIFELGIEAHPRSANSYDSAAEAYLVHGDKDLAIRNYRKALELDPWNTNAAKMVKKLEAE